MIRALPRHEFAAKNAHPPKYSVIVNLLLDTNIILPLEPASAADLESGSSRAVRLFNLAQEVGVGLFTHPQQILDIESDKDDARRQLRLVLLKKYRSLHSPPPLTHRVQEAAGSPEAGSNSWVDAHLAAALDQNSVDYLVSEDRGLHRLCRRLDIESRCLTLDAALDLLSAEQTQIPDSPPAVVSMIAYELDERDPIFEGLRSDYAGFDEWLAKCKREHRRAWIIRLPGRDKYAGVCIVNPEDCAWEGAENPTLKICTFKIAADATGGKLGELLLRSVFDFAHANGFQTLFLETFEKQGALLHLLNQFGFEALHGTSDSEQLLLRKKLSPTSVEDEKSSPLEYAKKFGPYSVKWSGVAVFAVPIEPRFHALLFPQMEPQGSLLAGIESFGNTLIKAYLCRAQTRRIRRGDLVVFYRSGDWQALTTLGVVEETLVTNDADEMGAFVRKRTVYRSEDIRTICAAGEALGITFRHAPVLRRRIEFSELQRAGVLSAPPQSITKLSPESLLWLKNHLS